MNLNAIMKNRSKAAYITLACAAVSLVTLIVFCIYGAVFNYFDVMVMLDLLFGAICFAGYFVFKT